MKKPYETNEDGTLLAYVPEECRKWFKNNRKLKGIFVGDDVGVGGRGWLEDIRGCCRFT